MADPTELTRLIQQLQRVSSPLQRAKMLARAWRSLRRLSPAQRQALADQVGIADGADLIEKLAAGKGGINPSVVQRALEAVGDTNVGDLRRVIRDLRDPEQRKAMVRKGLDAVTGSLAGPEAAPPSPPAARATKAAAVAAGAASAASVAAKPEPAAARPVAKPVVTPVAKEKAPAPTPFRTPAPIVTQTKPKPKSRPKPKAKPAPVGTPLLDRVGAETMISRRFRVFREHLEEARGLRAGQLRDLLDLFPSGWGQRRVLDMLLKRGIPDSLNQAVFLIEHLDSTPARRWCVKTLIVSRSLTDEEREVLVERHAVFRVAAATR